MKYGATIMVFAGTRTQDLMTMSLRLAGFEIKDTLMWFYGSGFPKGQNIGKQIDKQLGFEREIVGRNPNSRETSGKENTLYESGTVGKTAHITKPASPEAELWEGYSTHSIKPAYEPIIMAMKPNDGNYVSNALKWGVAGLNIKETRIPTDPKKDDMLRTVSRKKRQSETWEKGSGFKNEKNSLTGVRPDGRYPANILLDEKSAEILDKQAPNTGAFAKVKKGHSGKSRGICGDWKERGDDGATFYGDRGGASRFFYVAKTSKKERNMGLPDGTSNTHLTVKPMALMEYLVKFVKMPDENQVILDPFLGSGTTAMAVMRQNRNVVGIEISEEYCEIAKHRIEEILKKQNKTLDKWIE